MWRCVVRIADTLQREEQSRQAVLRKERRTERKGLVKPDLLLQGFRLDTNLTTQRKQGNFSGPFFMNGHFLQLKQLAALLCRLCFFLKGSLNTYLVNVGPLLDLSSPFQF